MRKRDDKAVEKYIRAMRSVDSKIKALCSVGDSRVLNRASDLTRSSNFFQYCDASRSPQFTSPFMTLEEYEAIGGAGDEVEE
jgi:hypothetical protein